MHRALPPPPPLGMATQLAHRGRAEARELGRSGLLSRGHEGVAADEAPEDAPCRPCRVLGGVQAAPQQAAQPPPAQAQGWG